MFCMKCGKQIPDHAKFCSGCGVKVTPAAASKPQKKEAASSRKPGRVIVWLLILAFGIAAAISVRLNMSIPEVVGALRRGEPLNDRAMYDLQLRLEERDTSLIIRQSNWDENLCPWSEVEWFLKDYLHATPELFYLDIRNTSVSVGEMDGKAVCYVKLAYLDGLASDAAQQQLEAAADRILQTVPHGTTNWEKALYIHDALVRCVAYEEGERDQTAYAALVDGKAVCMGYAMAYEYLLTRAGVEADTVCGYADEFSAALDNTLMQMPGHAWTVVTFTENGARQSCFVDTTWDDLGKTDTYGNEYVSHHWFGVTLEDIQREGRSTLATGYDLNQWNLNNSSLNYYVRNGSMIDSYDLDQIIRIMQDQIRQGSNVLSVRMADLDTYYDVRFNMEESGDLQKLSNALGIGGYAYSFSYRYTGDGVLCFDVYLDYPQE